MDGTVRRADLVLAKSTAERVVDRKQKLGVALAP
jgi:hypothetical protein